MIHDYKRVSPLFPAGAIALSGLFTVFDAPVLINDLNCTGDELSFLDCPQNSLTDFTCSISGDAAILCQGMYVILTNLLVVHARVFKRSGTLCRRDMVCSLRNL
jgi:hypothetical protein